MNKKITIALAGNPNAGKTSLFNELTGAHAHVGNYPGVTVQKKEGVVRHGDTEIHVVDLPGTYSLTAYSLEELVARNYLIDERPDLVVDVVDSANLDRNLYLALQFMEIGVPVVLAMNMMDIAQERTIRINLAKLSELLGVEVVPTVARQGKGVEPLLDAVVRTAEKSQGWQAKPIRYGADLDVKIAEISRLLEDHHFLDGRLPARWLAVKALEGDSQVMEMIGRDPNVGPPVTSMVKAVTQHLRSTLDDEPEGVIADHRYGFIASVTKQAVTIERDVRRNVSDHIDTVVLNRLLGPIFLLVILYAIYQFTFTLGDAPVGLAGNRVFVACRSLRKSDTGRGLAVFDCVRGDRRKWAGCLVSYL